MPCHDSSAAAHYFSMPCDLWFPDFSEALAAFYRHFTKYPVPFLCMSLVAQYFRGEIDCARFTELFISQPPPVKCLKKDLQMHQRIYTVCAEFQEDLYSISDFDKALTLAFRNTPDEDTFCPPPENRRKILTLIPILAQKQNSLPVHFDGIPWIPYLTGRMTRKAFAEHFLTFGVWDHLSQLIAYGTDRTFEEKFTCELSVCHQLQELCICCREQALTPEEFDSKLLILAETYCQYAT